VICVMCVMCGDMGIVTLQLRRSAQVLLSTDAGRISFASDLAEHEKAGFIKKTVQHWYLIRGKYA